MTPPNLRISHKKWIVYALIGIWWCGFGVSFIVRKQVSERLKRLPDDCDPKEYTALETALSLSRFGVIMSVLTWLGLFVMIFVSGEPQRSALPPERSEVRAELRAEEAAQNEIKTSIP